MKHRLAKLVTAALTTLLILLPSCQEFELVNRVMIQSSEGPTISFLFTGLCVDGQVWTPCECGHTERVLVHDPDEISIVIFQFEDTHYGTIWNVTGTQVEGNETRGVYSATVSRFFGITGGVFSCEITVFANDSFNNWNFAEGGYFSIAMGPSPILFPVLILVLIFIISLGKKLRN
jgi:hypothetical protein